MAEFVKWFVRLSATVALFAGIVSNRADAQSSTADGGMETWTLEDCQREALRQNRELRAANARMEAARSMSRQAGRWTNPAFSAGAVSDEREFYLTQEIDLWGKRSIASRLATAEADVVISQRGSLERELLEIVTSQYWNLARSYRLVALRTEELDAWKRFLDIREEEVKLGAFAHADMLLLRQETAERHRALRQVRFEADSTRAALNTLLVRPPNETLNVANKLPDDIRISTEELLAHALRTDSAANMARANLLAVGYRIEHEQRQWRPNPHIGPAAKNEDGRWAVGVQVAFSIPVWDRNRNGIQAAAAGREQADAEVESAELLAAQNAYHKFLHYETVTEMLAHYEAMVIPSIRERLFQVSKAFKTGDLSEREYLAVKLEWMRCEQVAETLRYQRADARSGIDLILRPPYHDHQTTNQ